jgi:hypothetical protein
MRQQREQDPFELHQRVENKLRALWKTSTTPELKTVRNKIQQRWKGWAAHVLALSIPTLTPSNRVIY